MKKHVLFIFPIFCVVILSAQKKPLDLETLKNWPEVGNSMVSNDGNYIAYEIRTPKSAPDLTVKSTKHNYHKTISEISRAAFTADSRHLVFIKHRDSMGIIELGKHSILYVPEVNSFKMPAAGNGQWIAYRLNTITNGIVLRNLFTGKEKKYPFVDDYYFNDSGKVLVLQTISLESNIAENRVYWIELPDGEPIAIMHGNKASNFSFDAKGSQLSFIVEGNNGDPKSRTLRHYMSGMDTAIVRVGHNTPGMKENVILGNSMPQFSKDGSKIFFTLQLPDIRNAASANTAPVNVDIWSYKDKYLQSQQLLELYERTKQAVINSNDSNVVCLEFETHTPFTSFIKTTVGATGEYILTYIRHSDPASVQYWEAWEAGKLSLYLVSTRNGTIKAVAENMFISNYALSGEGKYVIYYDQLKQAYFTYEVITGNTRNITRSVKTSLYNEEWDMPAPATPYGIAAWMPNDSAVLIYDQYDIWQIDPKGIKPPINITNGYGKKNQISLRHVATDGIRHNYFERNAPVIIQPSKILLLKGFNNSNKQEGYYQATTGLEINPRLLTVGPYKYDLESKSRYGDIYIIRRMSATQAPNLYVTTDFEHFKKISTMQPQRHYNWLTAELVHWQTTDGKLAEGILYKPENFNPEEKYPVIFHFYEKNTAHLNRFIKPDLSNGEMNIAYFVSNGYLVLEPNIYYTIGLTGESALKSILAAAQYISRMPWVDSSKMGLQGISFGGYEVNYIVTQTSLFTAAASSAGPVNFTSMYGSIRGTGGSNQCIFETGQNRLGSTLWEQPDLYVKNSPIFQANKVATPLLIMHNKKDESVPWSQGIEFFSALRRLGKKVWMLQYDEETHGIDFEKNKLDYSIRLKQFFDHYLKGAAAPQWMTRGVPARLKGIDTGLELDLSGKQP